MEFTPGNVYLFRWKSQPKYYYLNRIERGYEDRIVYRPIHSNEPDYDSDGDVRYYLDDISIYAQEYIDLGPEASVKEAYPEYFLWKRTTMNFIEDDIYLFRWKGAESLYYINRVDEITDDIVHYTAISTNDSGYPTNPMSISSSFCELEKHLVELTLLGPIDVARENYPEYFLWPNTP